MLIVKNYKSLLVLGLVLVSVLAGAEGEGGGVTNKNLLKIDNAVFGDNTETISNNEVSITKEVLCSDAYFIKKFPEKCVKKTKPTTITIKKVRKKKKKVKKKKVRKKKVKKEKVKKVYNIKKQVPPVDVEVFKEYVDIEEQQNAVKVYQPIYDFGRWRIEEVNSKMINNSYIDQSYQADYGSLGFPSLKHSLPLLDQTRFLAKSTLIPIQIDSVIFVQNKNLTINATVVENVFAKVGNKILIPAGSKANGKIQALKGTGLVTVNIFWDTIDTPKGLRINLNKSESVNASGVTGISGFVDNRNYQKYGMPLLFNLINNSLATNLLKIDKDNQAALTAIAKTAGDITNSIIKENINMATTIRIYAGKRLNIVTNSDVFFLPPIIVKNDIKNVN